MSNFKYNPSRQSNSYSEYNYNQNTSLHFDHFKEKFIDMLYEYKPHELYTNNIPTVGMELDRFGYVNLQTQDIGESWGSYNAGNSYGSTVAAGSNNTIDTGWDRVWVDQSWKFSLEIDSREGQLDSVAIAEQIGKFLRTTGKNCIDAYRFHRMFYFACNAKTYLNEFVNLNSSELPSDVIPGLAHKIGGDANGHSGNVFRAKYKAGQTALTSENLLHLHDSVEQNFENIQIPLDNNCIYMSVSAKRIMKDLGGNLQRYIEQDSADANIRRSVGYLDSWKIVAVPDSLLTVFFGKLDNPKGLSANPANSTSFNGGVSAVDTAKLIVASSAKDGYITAFNKAVITFLESSDKQSVKDFGTVLTDIYGAPNADGSAVQTEKMLMIHIGRNDSLGIIQQFREIKSIPYNGLVNSLSNIVELYWAHTLYSPVKLTGGIAVSLPAKAAAIKK